MQRYLRPDLLARRRRARLRRVGGDVRPDRHRDRDGADRRRQLPHEHPVRASSRTSPRCCACGTCSPTSRPPEDLDLPAPDLSARRPDGAAAPRRPSSSPAPGDAAPTSLQLGERAEAVRSQGGRSRRGQHAQDLRRRAQSRAGHAPGRRRAGVERVQARACRRRDRARSREPPRRRYRDPGTGERSPSAGRCRSCSATSAPRDDGALERLRRAARDLLAERGVPARAGAVHPRGRATTREKARLFEACRTGQVVGARSARPRRWASAPTSRRGRSRCTTSTARGGRRTSSSATAASCARATRTPRSRSSATSSSGASTPTTGRPSSARPGSSARSCAAGSTCARSTTSATAPCRFAEVKALASGDPLILEQAHS